MTSAISLLVQNSILVNGIYLSSMGNKLRKRNVSLLSGTHSYTRQCRRKLPEKCFTSIRLTNIGKVPTYSIRWEVDCRLLLGSALIMAWVWVCFVQECW